MQSGQETLENFTASGKYVRACCAVASQWYSRFRRAGLFGLLVCVTLVWHFCCFVRAGAPRLKDRGEGMLLVPVLQ